MAQIKKEKIVPIQAKLISCLEALKMKELSSEIRSLKAMDLTKEFDVYDTLANFLLEKVLEPHYRKIMAPNNKNSENLRQLILSNPKLEAKLLYNNNVLSNKPNL